MNISLYDRALSLEQPPQPLLVSPATLLSFVRSVIDLLVKQQISATIWLKSPPGEIWQAEIQRHQEVDVSDCIYTYKLSTTASEEVVNEVLQLTPSNQLRQEYFLLVLSSQFCGVILAHKPRMRRQTGVGRKTDIKITQPLQTICSFEERVIQQVLDGLKDDLTFQSQITSAELLTLDSRFKCPSVTESVLLSELLAKQIQQQDELRSNDNSYRTAVNKTKALQLQNQELLNTLHFKDDILSELCQELRTPLAHMKMALTLLNSTQLKPAQRQRYIQVLNTECDRQNSLINGLLDLMQLDRMVEKELQPIRLSDIVPGVVSTYQPLALEKGIMLAYTVPQGFPSVCCSISWLKQIVINLLHNSIKFTPSGGQVWVRSHIQGDYVQLEFCDTGIGIAPDEIPKVFDRFYRIRPVNSEDSIGAGLGLTIVQQLLLRCGGSISVKSKLGEGSTFNVLLPIYRDAKESGVRA